MSTAPRNLAALVTSVVVSVACATAPGELTREDLAAHAAMSQEFLDRVAAEDWVGLSRMYTEDAVVMQPGTDALVGRAAIRAYWEAMPPIKELRFEDDVTAGEGDLVYVHGRYWIVFDLPGEPSDRGKYLDVRKRQPDGGWKYVAEMANSSLPPPDHEPGRHERVRSADR